MPEDKLIELITWIGQKTAQTQMDYAAIYKSTLPEDQEKIIVLRSKSQAYFEVWGKILKVANNED